MYQGSCQKNRDRAGTVAPDWRHSFIVAAGIAVRIANRCPAPTLPDAAVGNRTIAAIRSRITATGPEPRRYRLSDPTIARRTCDVLHRERGGGDPASRTTTRLE
jgi:hypothetical protein